jgi:S-adenosylmethionine:tRNA ribosyltransferase-isomerase
VNDSRVIPARLFVKDAGDRTFELLLLEAAEAPYRWRTLVRPGRKVKTSLAAVASDGTPVTLSREGDAFFATFPESSADVFFRWLEGVGVPPLPPYIERPAAASDLANYQTVYARTPGSVAAPTAGLHFTESLLEALQAMGVHVERVTLHVGYGTFAPVQAERLEDHPMHAERYAVGADTWERLVRRKEEGGRVVAVGTTALRTLESVPEHGLSAATRLFVRPGYRFRMVDGLVTNFHLPKTTLLALVAAIVGETRWREIYRTAVEREYRFFSYGDAMLCLPFLDPHGGDR